MLRHTHTEGGNAISLTQTAPLMARELVKSYYLPAKKTSRNQRLKDDYRLNFLAWKYFQKMVKIEHVTFHLPLMVSGWVPGRDHNFIIAHSWLNGIICPFVLISVGDWHHWVNNLKIPVSTESLFTGQDLKLSLPVCPRSGARSASKLGACRGAAVKYNLTTSKKTTSNAVTLTGWIVIFSRIYR